MGKLLDHNTFEPLYHQLKRKIDEEIEAGKWNPGDKISSENEFKKEYQISRNTVQRALDELVQEGTLERIQGRGTFVARPKIEQSLTGFYSFSRVMEEKKMSSKDVILSINIETAHKKVAKHLKIDNEEEVFSLKRLRHANGEPIILETSYLPKRYIPLLSQEEIEKHSLYDFLKECHNITVVKAREAFEPVIVKDCESKLLQMDLGAPGLLLDRIAYDERGRIVEYCRSIVRGDRCRFYTELL